MSKLTARANNSKQIVGFTFIEVIVSLAVITIAILAIIQIFPFGVQTGKSAEQNTTAVALAQGKLEEFTAATYDDISAGTLEDHQRLSDNPTDTEYYYWRTTIVSYVDADFNTSATETGLKKISVTVFWKHPQSPNPERSITLTTVIAQKWRSLPKNEALA